MRKTKIIGIFLALLLSIFSFPTAFADSESFSLYVSPTGNDQNDGTLENPLATIKGARDKIRKIKETDGLPKGGITVYFRDGEYSFFEKEEIENVSKYTYSYGTVFGERDSGTAESPIKYCAYPNEKPIFTGGFRVENSKFSTETLSNGTSVEKFNVKNFLKEKLGREIALEEYCYFAKDAYDLNSYSGRVMYSLDKNENLHVARYPNKVAWKYEENPITQYMKTGTILSTTKDNVTFNYSDDRIFQCADTDDVWIIGLFSSIFYQREAKVAEIDKNAKTIKTLTVPDGGIKDNKEFFVCNVLNELDTKNEYYVSKDGDFYVFDTDFEYLNIPVSDVTYMLACKNASNITFQNINFENSKGSGFYVRGGENIVIDGCDFYNFCNNAVVIGEETENNYTLFRNSKWDQSSWELFYGLTDEEKITKQIEYQSTPDKSVAVRGKNHGIKNSTVKNTGLSSVIVSGGNFYVNEESGYFVENCDISFSGVNKRTYEPALRFANTFGVSVKNNVISHNSANAIGGYISKGVIENNDIFDNLSDSYDMGVIYLNYIMPVMDLNINNNYIHDTPSETEITDSLSTVSQRSAIAFDNSYGSGAKITNNIIKNIPRGIWSMGCETAVNNVFIDCFDPICNSSYNGKNYWYIDSIEGGNKDDFFADANESMYKEGLSFMKTWSYFEKGEAGDKIKAEWQEKYPEMTAWIEIVTNQIHKGKKFFNFHHNLFVNTYGYWSNKTEIPGAIPTATAEELNNLYIPRSDSNVYATTTNFFKDYENNNFDFTYSAKVRFGFEDIDFDNIGNVK